VGSDQYLCCSIDLANQNGFLLNASGAYVITAVRLELNSTLYQSALYEPGTNQLRTKPSDQAEVFDHVKCINTFSRTYYEYSTVSSFFVYNIMMRYFTVVKNVQKLREDSFPKIDLRLISIRRLGLGLSLNASRQTSTDNSTRFSSRLGEHPD
jgi:hypothetical protein